MAVQTIFRPDGVLRVQDTTPYAEQNLAQRNEDRSSRKHWMFLIANIPNVIIEKWCNDFGVNLLALPKEAFVDFCKARLCEPEWHWLRTAPDRFYDRRRAQKRIYTAARQVRSHAPSWAQSLLSAADAVKADQAARGA